MRRLSVLISTAAVSVASLPAGFAAGDLIISEYVEGSGNNKALELYNAGNITLTNPISVELYFNGGTSPSQTIGITPNIPVGGVWVIVNSGAASPFTNVADTLTGSLSFNGNDAIVVRDASFGFVVDSLGQVGFDPGAGGWSDGGSVVTADQTLQRINTTADLATGDAYDPGVYFISTFLDDASGLGSSEGVPVELSVFGTD